LAAANGMALHITGYGEKKKNGRWTVARVAGGNEKRKCKNNRNNKCKMNE